MTKTLREQSPYNQSNDFDRASGSAIEQGLLRRKAEVNDQSEEIRQATIGDAEGNGKEDNHPGKRVSECFSELIHFEFLVADSLLVDSHALNGEDTLFFWEPACVQLVVGQEEEDEPAGNDGEEAGEEENGAPGCHGEFRRLAAVGKCIGDKPSEDLGEAVKGDPDPNSGALLGFCVPLFLSQSWVVYYGCFKMESNLCSRQCKARWNARFENAKKKANDNCAGVVLHRGKAGVDDAPKNSTQRDILAQGKL